MDRFRSSGGFEQKLLVTFRAHSLDLQDIAEDMAAAAPSARIRCASPGMPTQAGALSDVVDVGLELPDDAALLNGVMAVIFHAQDKLEPMIKVRRIFGDAAIGLASLERQATAAIAAAA